MKVETAPVSAGCTVDIERRIIGVVSGDDGPQRELCGDHSVTSRSSAISTAALQLIAHELANPLTTLAMNASVLSELPGSAGLIACDIRDQATRLQTTVANLLDLARLEDSSLATPDDVFGTRDLAASAVELVANHFEPDAITVELTNEIPPIHFNRRIAERALANIVRNALRHGAPPVRISALHSGSTISILVDDSGPGVALDHIETDLFRPFRPFGARSRLGLGLWLSRELMRLGGGDIRLRTASPTCFQVDFPCTLKVAA